MKFIISLTEHGTAVAKLLGVCECMFLRHTVKCLWIEWGRGIKNKHLLIMAFWETTALVHASPQQP